MYKEETVNELLSEGNIAAKIGLELTEEKEPIKEVELEEAKVIGLKKLAKQLGSIFDKLDDAYVDISGDDVMSKSRKEAINNVLELVGKAYEKIKLLKESNQDGTGSTQGASGKGMGPGQGKNKEDGCDLEEVGSNDNLEQAIKRADKFYKLDVGAREIVSYITKNYTDRVIFQFVDKYQDKLRKRAKEEVKLVEDMIKSHGETLKKHPDLQESELEEGKSGFEFNLDKPYLIEVKRKSKGSYDVLLLKDGGVKSVVKLSESIEESELKESNWNSKDDLLAGITFEELIDMVHSNEKVKDESAFKKSYKELLRMKVKEADSMLKTHMKDMLKEIKEELNKVLSQGSASHLNEALPPVPNSAKEDKVIAKEASKEIKAVAKKHKINKWMVGFDGKFNINIAPNKIKIEEFRKDIVDVVKPLAKKYGRVFKDGGTRASQGEFWVSDFDYIPGGNYVMKFGFALKSF